MKPIVDPAATLRRELLRAVTSQRTIARCEAQLSPAEVARIRSDVANARPGRPVIAIPDEAVGAVLGGATLADAAVGFGVPYATLRRRVREVKGTRRR